MSKGKLIVYTDPHLGLQRAANTTPASKVRLQDQLFQSVADIHAMKGEDDELICNGDFFDTYSNDEEVIAKAYPLLRELKICLGGNHDVVNRASKMGSLELLSVMVDREYETGTHHTELPMVIQSAYGFAEAKSIVYPDDPVALHFVPHVATADLFDDSLRMAIEKRQKAAAMWGKREERQHQVHYLFVHANWDNPLAAEKDATLNLCADDADYLLTEGGFDYIVLGHVHQPLDTKNGRVIVLGNTHPTGFGDTGTKRIMLIDKATGQPEFKEIYRAADHEATFDITQGDVTLRNDLRFVTLTGELPVARAPELAAVIKRCWETLPNLMALRSQVTFESQALAKHTDTVAFTKLPDHIEKELQSEPELLALWKELTNA